MSCSRTYSTITNRKKNFFVIKFRTLDEVLTRKKKLLQLSKLVLSKYFQENFADFADFADLMFASEGKVVHSDLPTYGPNFIP